MSRSLSLDGITGYAAELLTETATDSVPESYELQIAEDAITIRHGDERGLIYGCVTIRWTMCRGTLFTGTPYDRPNASYCGHRSFLPGQKSFFDFYRIFGSSFK